MREGYVQFQDREVKKEFRDAYMAGYDNPYGPNEGGKYSRAYESGQTAARQDNCLEGTF